MIVGGEAVIYHGHLRLTGDTDYFYELSPQNSRKLFVSLMEFWGGQVPGLASAEELLTEGLIVQFGVPPNRLDLLNRIDGVSFADAWENRVEESITTDSGAISVAFIGLKELIRNKAASGRPRDQEDLFFLKSKLDL